MPSDLQVSNLKALDGTSGISIANSTGNVSLNGTLSGKLLGVTDGSSASAGEVGECIEVQINGGDVDTNYDSMGSITLTAGDWDLSANVFYSGSGSMYMNTALTTTEDSASGTSTGKDYQNIDINNTTGIGQGFFQFRVSVTSTTTYYLNAKTNAGSGTYVYAWIHARRMR